MFTGELAGELAGVLTTVVLIAISPVVSVILSELTMADICLGETVVEVFLSCTEAIFSTMPEAQGPK